MDNILDIFEVASNVYLFVGYILNSKVFDKPLKAKEEYEYIERFKNGDGEARNVLIERNLRLVAHIAKKFHGSSCEKDDLISIGTIGLIKGVKTFNNKKGTRLATYASKCIENEILMYLRSAKKVSNQVYLQEPIGMDKEGNEIALIDIIPNEDDEIIETVDLKIQMKRLYGKMKQVLKKREKLIIELRYGLVNGASKTQKEIGKMLGISRSYVSRIEKKAINKLHNEMKI